MGPVYGVDIAAQMAVESALLMPYRKVDLDVVQRAQALGEEFTQLGMRLVKGLVDAGVGIGNLLNVQPIA
nr:hypothetical protein [Halomonas socia]